MKIEAGKYYRTRDGRKVGPMRHGAYGACDHEFDVDHHAYHVPAPYGGYLWNADGKAFDSERGDLIAEWTDAPDLTAITTPFGLLDRETQEALKAHGGPWQYWFPEDGWRDYRGIGDPTWTVHTVYRVKPAPPKPRE